MSDKSMFQQVKEDREQFEQDNSQGDFGGIKVAGNRGGSVIYYPNGSTCEIDPMGYPNFYWASGDSNDFQTLKLVEHYWELALEDAREEFERYKQHLMDVGPCTGGSVSLGKRREQLRRTNPPYRTYWVDVEDKRPMTEAEIDKENKDRKRTLRRLREKVKHCMKQHAEYSQKLDEKRNPPPLPELPEFHNPAKEQWREELNEINI